eukprot:TRINITY_DN5507_c0_g1_i1.p1 TRINITY_DN5507_c0_g1~~TRINITY_DN5507_c0_g1_i1.p1  ORF type:complete len:983 (-),score=152.47 TRINITY_DN5507_c0_g1_i1:111-3026(-)
MGRIIFAFVGFLLCCCCVIAAVHVSPSQSSSESHQRGVGVFDKKLDRAAAIEEDWKAQGFDFHTITDAERPFGVCMFGKPYEVRFNVTVPTDAAFLRVDTQPGYAGVVCNLDHTDIQFHFASQAEATAFQQAAASGHPVLTGAQGRAECLPNKGLFHRVVLVAESIVAVNPSPFGADTTFAVRVRSFKASYDHIIKSGTVEFGSAAEGSRFAHVCDKPEGGHFCIGLNTDKDCTAAAGPITFYQNQYVTLECADCWLAFSMDVNLKMELEDFLLYDSHFLFSNMVVNGALVAQMIAQYQWGVNYDATIPIIGPTNIVQFWLGPIPIIIGFELPLQRVADASFSASAQAEAGAQLQWSLGDYKVLWNPLQGWRAEKGVPGLIYRPVVSGEAQFDGNANFGLAPSLTANLDSFFTTQLFFSAMLHADVQGSTTTKQICANVNYDVSAQGSATLEIAIPWIDFDKSWTWSHSWFSESGTIAQACTKVAAYNVSAPAVVKQLEAKPAIAQEKPQKKKVANVKTERGPLGVPTKNLQGKNTGCFNNRGYTMSYNVTMAESYNLIDLPSFPGFRKLDCNAGGNNFRIEWHHDDNRKEFFRQVNGYTTFLTGNKALSDRCNGLFDTTVFLFRVTSLKDTTIPFIKYQAEVGVSSSRYDEVFQQADISMQPDDNVFCGAPTVTNMHADASEHVCLGVNTNSACNAAQQSLLMYTGQYLTVQCSNCYFALQTDIFFELHIKDYWVQARSGGYKNMVLDAAMILDVLAHVQWNSGTNVSEDAVAPTTILDFAIGPIPVRIWFEIPLRRLAEVEVDIKASVSAGVLAHWSIGDHYVTYTAGSGWSHVKPNPVLSWRPMIGPVTAQFNASALLGLIPTFAFHVDSIFWTTLTIDPEITLAANGSLARRQVCASAKGAVTVTAYAELDFNIPFIYLHLDAYWGPQTVYSSGTKPLGSVCHNFQSTPPTGDADPDDTPFLLAAYD